MVVDVRGGGTETVSVQKPLALDTTPFKSQRVMVKETRRRAGAAVHRDSRKDMVADGQHPTGLTGYGICQHHPGVQRDARLELERGGVTTTGCMRGGGG